MNIKAVEGRLETKPEPVSMDQAPTLREATAGVAHTKRDRMNTHAHTNKKERIWKR